MNTTIKLITDFLFICEENVENLKNAHYDFVIVCGNDNIDITIDAVENIIKSKKLSPDAKIVLSGNVGALDSDKSPEAIRLYNEAIKRNIPTELFLVEDKATNSKENFEFSKQILESNNFSITNSKYLVICKSFLSLRAKMSAASVGFNTEKNVEFLGVIDSTGRNVGKETWYLSEAGRERVYAEIERIGKYSLKGDLSIY